MRGASNAIHLSNEPSPLETYNRPEFSSIRRGFVPGYPSPERQSSRPDREGLEPPETPQGEAAPRPQARGLIGRLTPGDRDDRGQRCSGIYLIACSSRDVPARRTVTASPHILESQFGV